MGSPLPDALRLRLVRTRRRHCAHWGFLARCRSLGACSVKPQTGHILATEYCLWASEGVTLWGPLRCKLFTSVQAFDGYVKELRCMGYLVTFSNPFCATVARPLL